MSRRARSVLVIVGLAAALVTLPLAVLGQSPASLRPAIAARHPSVGWVDVETLARWLEGDAPVVLLDARAPEEHAVSHLRGAVRVDPDARRHEVTVPPGARVVVYCSVGWRSAAVAERLRERGVEALNLEGGIFAWANRGHPVFREGRRVAHVHPYDATWGRMLRPEVRAPVP